MTIRERYKSSDNILEISFGIITLISFCISPIYNTFIFALPIVTLLLSSYYASKYLLPDKTLYQYVGSACLALFTALLIYQMHGMIEMHFVAFIGAILLINFQKWELQIPITLLVVIHHGVLAYIQYLGYKEVYFTSNDYMDLQTFIAHVGLAAIIFFLSGLWAFKFKQASENLESKNEVMENQMVIISKNIIVANQISKGILDTEFEALKEDELGNALKIMQENLLIAQKKEAQEKFLNLGVAQASEIMRKFNHDLAELSNQVLVYLTKYLGANQGALFVLNDNNANDKYLELAACYAWDKRRYIDKRVNVGEGLVGQAWFESDVIYITEVPQNFISITSGLGDANPSSILIVPLTVNGNTYGVIEIASFKLMEDYQIEFVKKLAENIASTISGSRTNERTKVLLEQSQLNAEQMRAQEEEMRQNMEEMQATSEEAERKAMNYEAAIQRLNDENAQLSNLLVKNNIPLDN